MTDFLREKYSDMLDLFCNYLEKDEFGASEIAKRLTNYAERGHDDLERQMGPTVYMVAEDFINETEFIHQAVGFIMGVTVGTRLMVQAMPFGMEMTSTALRALMCIVAEKEDAEE